MIQDEKFRGINERIGKITSRRTSRAPSPPKQDDRIDSPIATASRRSLLWFREEEREAELEEVRKRDSIMGGRGDSKKSKYRRQVRIEFM